MLFVFCFLICISSQSAFANYFSRIELSSFEYTFTATNDRDVVWSKNNAEAKISASPIPYVSTFAYARGQVRARGEVWMGYDFGVTGAPNSIMPISITSNYRISGGYAASSRVGIITNVRSSVDSYYYDFRHSCNEMLCAHQNFRMANTRIPQVELSDEVIGRIGDFYITYKHDFGEIYDKNYIFDENSSIKQNFLLQLDEFGSGIGYVEINAYANSIYDGTFASALIDPYIEIGESYLSMYPNSRLDIEEGVGNANPSLIPSVPVPAALPLMASALGIFGIARRRNKSNTV